MDIKQYPHFLYRFYTQEGAVDEYGSIVVEEPRLEYISICREETNGKGAQTSIAGGEAFIFSSVIYVPSYSAPLKEGEEILVTDKQISLDAPKVRARGNVKKYDKGALHNRIWI